MGEFENEELGRTGRASGRKGAVDDSQDAMADSQDAVTDPQDAASPATELDDAPRSDDGPHSDDAPSSEHGAAALRKWRVRARRTLDRDYVLEEVEPGSPDAARVLALHESMKTRARLYAEHLAQLAAFFREDPEVKGLLEDSDVTALKIATGLRCTYLQAQSQVRDAHTAVAWMPEMFAHLVAGDLPEAWHHSLLRHVRRLDEEQVRSVDAHMAGVEIPSVSKDTFDRQVTLGVALATAGTLPTPAAESRNVELVDVNTETGTASLCVTGPILEIQALAHRLDVTARTVQKAQRAGLEDGAEGPLPFDIDQTLHERGRPLSLGTLRYAILTHSVLDIDPVQDTTSPYKLLVTVPATTLLGIDDAPALLEGKTPIPAEQARLLAAGEKTWQRILTDPVTGAHLPVTAETYQPTAQMRLQLRLRHPVCAVPGCGRATVIAAEDDHIIEYDHDHPASGGQTSLWNLHRLCWFHHTMKTAGLIDPTRDPADDPSRGDGTTTAGPVETTWLIGETIRTRTREHTDLLTPHTVKALERAWRTHQRAYEDAKRLYEEAKARPHQDRAREDRAHAWRKAYPRPKDDPTPDTDDGQGSPHGPGERGSRDSQTASTVNTGDTPGTSRDRRIIPPGLTLDETEPPF